MAAKRGALIVVEGCDRAGKTTQCKRLVESLTHAGRKVMYMNFPNRSTDCGKLINAFLTKQQDFDHETIHLLFSMNRWESKKQMERLLNEGTSLIIDRYSFSGVAYSAAKGLNIDWCKAPEKNLLKPDLVLYLTLTTDAIVKRGGFGDERHDTYELQQKVNRNFEAIFDTGYWHRINADKSEDDLQKELLLIAENVIDEGTASPLTLLW